MHIDYIDQFSDDTEEFRQKVSEVVKPVQQARKDQGIITDWYLYRVEYPGTHQSQYNYVSITISEQISAFEDITDGVAAEFEDRNSQQLVEEFEGVFTPNHSELWRIRNSVMQDENSRPSRYMVKNYMNVGQGYEFEYQMMEDETARPLHQRRMENDVMKGWELNAMILPGGLEYGYNFSTIDYYDHLEHVEFGFTEELILQTHPDTDINEFFENINRSRDLVRREVWELVDSLD
ncbi:hypothetical protein [Rhodohalobacter mucosus]|nr:hypothetical protein [Rhodohalobacter mucosus]